jgi:hypothetical protein
VQHAIPVISAPSKPTSVFACGIGIAWWQQLPVNSHCALDFKKVLHNSHSQQLAARSQMLEQSTSVLCVTCYQIVPQITNASGQWGVMWGLQRGMMWGLQWGGGDWSGVLSGKWAADVI